MYCRFKYPYRDITLNHNGLTEVPDYYVDEFGNYVSKNPKTLDVRRYIRTKLDRPSTSGSLPLCKIYTSPLLDNYTSFNVNNGQITYYIDDSIKNPHYDPIYQIRHTSKRIDYIDPMTSYKPHYNLVQKNNDIYNFSPLSSINDSTFHRENLIASQQAKYDQTRITPFF